MCVTHTVVFSFDTMLSCRKFGGMVNSEDGTHKAMYCHNPKDNILKVHPFEML